VDRPAFEVLDHTADTALRVWGEDVGGLFLNAARGMLSLMVNVESVRPAERVPVGLEEETPEELLVAWLERPIVLLEADGFVCGEAGLEACDGRALKGWYAGEALDRGRHRLFHGIKAVTYHGLQVRREGDVWTVDIIFDV
jgi:SHS2 domain-containing protein